MIGNAQAAVPAPPQNLQPAWLFGEVMLTWNEVPEATSYTVHRYDTNSAAWAPIATGLTLPRYRDEGVYDPQSYTVTAVNAEGESGPAEPVVAEQTGDSFLAMLNSTSTWIYDTAVVLSWSVDLAAGADARLELGTSWTNLTYFAWNTNYSGFHTFTVTNLMPETSYEVRMTFVASNRTGVATWFNFVTSATNRPPFVQDQTFQTCEDHCLPLEMWLSAWDPDYLQPLIRTIVNGPLHGTLVETNGVYYYTPDTNFFGTDTFTYVASDGRATSEPATITIEVSSWNDPPQPISGNVEVIEDIPLDIAVQATDVEGHTVTSVQIVQWPTNGWLSVEGAIVRYNPMANQSGADSFMFNVCDSGGACGWEAPGTIHINVVPANDAPGATNVFFHAHAEATFHGTFSVGDLDGDPLTCELVSPPPNGTVTISGTNFTYTPNPDSGTHFTDTFTYRASDGQTNSNEATVWMIVGNTNTVPVANDQTVTAVNNRDWWIALDVVDPDPDNFQVQLLAAPTNGTIQFQALGAVYHSASNYVGPDSFTYQVFDGTATGNVATVTLDVIPNRSPIADPLTMNVPEDATIDFNVSGSDADGDPISFVIVSNPGHGTLTERRSTWPFIGPPGGYRYRPVANFNGADSFTFTVNDGITNGNLATVSITVTPVNDAPGVYSTNVTTVANTPLNFVLGASDIDGDALTFEIVPPTNGVLSGTAPNLTFTPETDWTGTNTLRFRVNDGSVWSAWATVTIVVTPTPNRAPAAQNQSVTVAVNTATAITLGATDPDGQALTFSILSGPAHGSLGGSGANRTYTPAGGYMGSDAFTFRATDPFGLSATGMVSITVFQPNRPPVGQNRAHSFPEDWILYFGVSASDADGDPLTYRVVTPPAHGTLTIDSSMQDMRYRAFTNYTGTDSFTWVANDGKVDSAVYSFTFTLTPMNDAPVVTNQTVSTQEDTPVTIVPLAGDVDGDPLTFVVSTPPASGSVTVNGGALLYTPAPNFHGGDTFEYQAHDGSNGLATATITIIVLPVSDSPTGNPQTATTAEDTTVWLTLSGSDADGGNLTYTVTSSPTHGTLMGTPPIVGYTPTANFNGGDSFIFRVTDADGNSGTAAVNITVTPVNDAPVADAQSISVTEDTATPIALLGFDVEGDALTSTIESQPAHGSIQLLNGNWVYTPAANYNGPDSFTFTVSDGSSASGIATVSIAVSAVNDVPSADGQPMVMTDEDTSASITLTGSDIDGDALNFVVVTGPAHGTLSGTGANLIYTPASNFNGLDAFTFRASDGTTNSAEATVSITVTAVNDIPLASAQSVTFAEDSIGIIPVTAMDADGDALSPIVVAAASHGSVGNWDGQSWTYIPDANYNGPDSFTFQVSDGQATSAPVTVTITVTPVNDAPTGLPQGVATDEDTSLSFTPDASDVDGDSIGFVIETAPVHGTITVDEGQLVYAANPNFNGEDSVAYRPTDGSATGEVAHVVITVRSVNDAPAAAAQTISTSEDSAVAVTLSGTDVEGSALAFTIISGPAHGTLSGTAPNLTYTPAANYNGLDSFTFKVNDGTVDSAAATISINVTAVNDTPVANPQSVSTAYNTAVNITLSGTDVEGGALTYTVVNTPANGTLSGTTPNLTFTPNIGWSGTTSFTFKVNDGVAESATATVTITVTGPGSIPTAPSSLTASAVSSTQINLTWNDNSANEDGFKIERSTNGSTWTQIATVGRNVRTYASTGLSANKTYYYRVRAHNVLGNSAYSNTASAKTLR